MKLKLLLLTFILVCTGCKNDPRIQAAYDLIERVTPGYGEQFKLELMEPIDGMDAYEITSDNGKVVLRGNNTISLATAFNQYLKYTCNAHVSWFGNQLDLPKQLPMPAPVKNTINGKYRVYMNYCTVSYSAAWWDWERWQRELDFMAMNSINMPLSTIPYSNISLQMKRLASFWPVRDISHGNGCRTCKAMEGHSPNLGLTSISFWENRLSTGSWNWGCNPFNKDSPAMFRVN